MSENPAILGQIQRESGSCEVFVAKLYGAQQVLESNADQSCEQKIAQQVNHAESHSI
jgi:hypothetical protein